jgi:hypothetical protein
MLSPVWGLLTWYILAFFTVALSGLLVNVLRENAELKNKLHELESENTNLKKHAVEKLICIAPSLMDRGGALFDSIVAALESASRFLKRTNSSLNGTTDHTE